VRLEVTLPVIPEVPGLLGLRAAGHSEQAARASGYAMVQGFGSLFSQRTGATFNQLVRVALSRKEMTHARVLGSVLSVQLDEHDAEGHRAPVDTL